MDEVAVDSGKGVWGGVWAGVDVEVEGMAEEVGVPGVEADIAWPLTFSLSLLAGFGPTVGGLEMREDEARERETSATGEDAVLADADSAKSKAGGMHCWGCGAGDMGWLKVG